MWDGHSCPSLLTWPLLYLAVTGETKIKTNFNGNGDGQECPSHTNPPTSIVHTRLLDLNQAGLREAGLGVLRGAPGIEDGNLMHAGNGAVGRAGFFREVFAANVVARV